MNSKTLRQTFKTVLCLQGIVTLLLATTGSKASAIDIKNTNYPIPNGAYFVSPSGKNTSCKSSSSPCSVAKALRLAPKGATVVFRGGTYRNVKVMLRKQLTLQPYPHEKAWLKGSLVVTGWIANGRTWRKDGWKYSFPQNMNKYFIDPKYPLAGRRDMVYINGVSLKQVASKAAVVSGTFYVDAANKQLYIGSNPAGKTVEATALDVALAMWRGSSSDPSNTVVRGLGFAHYADRGLIAAAPGIKLEKNTFAWNGQEGVSLIKPNAIVRDNTFSYNGRVGFRSDGAHNLLLENNIFSHNNVELFAKNWDAAGAKITQTDGLVSRRNLFEHNLSTGFWLDTSSTNTTVVHNTTRYNQGFGIFLEISDRAIVAANLVHHNKTGIGVSNSSRMRVYNNTLANNGTNLRLKDTKRNNTKATEIAQGITWIARGNVFKNNILSNTTGNPLFDFSNCDTREASEKTANTDYNAYYRTSSSKPRVAVKWSLGSSKCAAEYTSVNALEAATGYETHALVIDNTPTNPFFVSEAKGDYRLKSGSKAIGHGQALPADIAKAIGISSGVPVDLGAFQSRVVLD